MSSPLLVTRRYLKSSNDASIAEIAISLSSDKLVHGRTIGPVDNLAGEKVATPEFANAP